jgi:CHC2 zinc finger
MWLWFPVVVKSDNRSAGGRFEPERAFSARFSAPLRLCVTVNPDKQFFHCFSCKAGGDVFGFLMKIEGIEFFEALAERQGI